MFASASENDIEYILRRLSLLEAHVGYNIEDEPEVAAVMEEIHAGRDISAAKRWQDAFGSSLGEAQRAVKFLGKRRGA